jgi:hypothetical protein
MDAVERKAYAAIRSWLVSKCAEVRIGDIDAVSVVLLDMVNSLVHRVVFGQMPVSRKRLISEGVNAMLSVVRLGRTTEQTGKRMRHDQHTDASKTLKQTTTG